jgi:endonuclease/exonuclease/phosphatase family metal-dependent hydrolase
VRWKARLCAMLLASAFFLAGAVAARADVVQTFKVWDWNIAGHKMHVGSTTNGVVEASVASIVEADADFASFNEICWNQYKAIQARLAATGWPASNDFSRFAATRDADDGLCGGTGSFGQALFSRHDLGNSRQYELPWDGKAGTRKLLCAPLQSNSLMKFCTVHITTQSASRPQQLDAVLGLLNGFDAASETYIIAGDFNAQPHYDQLNAYYASSVNTPNNSNNTGAHRELDDAYPGCPGYGDWTADVEPPTLSPCDGFWKVDSIFVRENRIAGPYSAKALPIPTSCNGRCADHRAITGTVSLRVSTP